MVMSIQEEITVLEEQFNNSKGPGSKEKRAQIQEKIDELKESLKDDDEGEKAPDEKSTSNYPPGVSEEDMPGKFVPLPTNWVRVTMEEVQTAEKNGTLCGYDPIRNIALIRGR